MLRLFSICLCATVALASAPAMADTAARDLLPSAQQIGEWSSASKPKRKRTVTVYRDYPPPYRSYGWRAADPSFDQYGRPYRNPFPGQCMIDLGYGRWESCSQVR
jgi:hypothetical protein